MSQPRTPWPAHPDGRPMTLSEMSEAQRRVFQPIADLAKLSVDAARDAIAKAAGKTVARRAKPKGPTVGVMYLREWMAIGEPTKPVPPMAVRIHSASEAEGSHYVVYGVKNTTNRLWSVVRRDAQHGGFLPVAHFDKLKNAVTRAAMLNAGIVP